MDALKHTVYCEVHTVLNDVTIHKSGKYVMYNQNNFENAFNKILQIKW